MAIFYERPNGNRFPKQQKRTVQFGSQRGRWPCWLSLQLAPGDRALGELWERAHPESIHNHQSHWQMKTEEPRVTSPERRSQGRVRALLPWHPPISWVADRVFIMPSVKPLMRKYVCLPFSLRRQGVVWIACLIFLPTKGRSPISPFPKATLYSEGIANVVAPHLSNPQGCQKPWWSGSKV